MLARATEALASVLRIAPDARAQLDPHAALGDHGLDSLMAAELALHLAAATGVAIPVAFLLGGASLSGVSERIAGELAKENA